MIGAFSSLKSLIKGSRVSIDNGVFLLHYKFTVLALLVCTMMISCKQHFGEPITCLADNSDVKFGRATDAYCWVHETYTVNELIDGKAGNFCRRVSIQNLGLTFYNTFFRATLSPAGSWSWSAYKFNF